MQKQKLLNLLSQIGKGRVTPDEALRALEHLPYEDLSCARVDHHRTLRQGIPEVVFAEGKTPDETAEIARAIVRQNSRVLITRASNDHMEAVRKAVDGKTEFHEKARSIVARQGPAKRPSRGNVLILTAGTSDMAVAEEARVASEFLGNRTTTAYDMGVAGLHRLMDRLESLKKARVIVVVAGMEGALPSVVGGLTDRPIVAVPTSVGYGAALGGLTALFAMLNSCVPGIAVMNIDNGFGAACLAHRINRR